MELHSPGPQRAFRRAIYIAGSLTLLGACSGKDPPPSTTADASAGATSDAQPEPASAGPTWHQHIAPLVAAKCSSCHKTGGIAPFSLETYDGAKPFAARMALAVEAGTMPPFLAQDTADCKPKQRWQNDLRLSSEEKELFRDWSDADAPEGDPETAAAITPPASVELEREDVIIPLPSEIVIEGERDLHVCVVADPKLSKDEYVVGRFLTAGNAKVLHHVVSHVIEPGTVDDNGRARGRTKAELEQEILREKGVGIGGAYPCFGSPGLTNVTTQVLDTWGPGSLPNLAPPNAGQPVTKESLVLLDLHYHPTGTTERDSATKLSLMLARDKPQYVARSVVLGNFERATTIITPTGAGGIGDLVLQPGESKAEFLIPANAKEHVEDMTWRWILPLISARITAIATHMHYVGRAMRVSLQHAAPNAGEDPEECLIETPEWDFNWQRSYAFDAAYESLPEVRNDDVMKLHCEFDNSTDHPALVQALQNQQIASPVDVHLGNDTLDEMCATIVDIMFPNPG